MFVRTHIDKLTIREVDIFDVVVISLLFFPT